MRDVTTEENIKKLIESIPDDATPLEKVILANEGTVQTLLSVVFGVPIKVEVLSQLEMESFIVRWVSLVADYGSNLKLNVCLAESVIDKRTECSGFINGIREKTFGIGQLLSASGIRTERELLGFYIDKGTFSRTYVIHGTDIKLSVVITEVFQKDTFKRIPP